MGLLLVLVLESTFGSSRSKWYCATSSGGYAQCEAGEHRLEHRLYSGMGLHSTFNELGASRRSNNCFWRPVFSNIQRCGVGVFFPIAQEFKRRVRRDLSLGGYLCKTSMYSNWRVPGFAEEILK
jgi:hypothetical protein